MADTTHLFGADKVRIANEAKVRTALEQPDFAQREFKKWKAEKDRDIRAESIATGWAKVAWLAEGRMLMMGRNLNKLQQRIGRQRKANREQKARIEQLEKERYDFFCWAEELASHGFNCTVHNAGGAKFYPLVKRYWNEMFEQREALSEPIMEHQKEEENANS